MDAAFKKEDDPFFARWTSTSLRKGGSMRNALNGTTPYEHRGRARVSGLANCVRSVDSPEDPPPIRAAAKGAPGVNAAEALDD
jgi:hypothetical protein